MTAKLPVFFAFYFICSLAQAQVYNSSVASATGGTGRAAVEAGDSIYLNPATLPHFRGRHLLSSFTKDQLAISFSDNTEESVMPGALAFLQTRQDGYLGSQQYEIRTQNIGVALASFVKGGLTVGLLGHFSESKYNDLKQSSYRQSNVDLGLAYVLNQNFGAGATFYNLGGVRENIPADIQEQMTAGFGINYIYRSFVRYRLDVVSAPKMSFSKPTYMAGIESFITGYLVWRLGYQDNTLISRQLLTAGAGLNGPKFALNYAYQGNTKESSDYRHSVDLQIPF